MIYILMGVSGCGKTTIGRLLAERLECPLIDADDMHPAENRTKMKLGEPLTDADRQPWLEALAGAMASDRSNKLVVACSALKDSYRHLLQQCGRPITWIVLHGQESLLQERLETRAEHFFPPKLLASQIETLEPPVGAWHIDIDDDPASIVDRIMGRIKMAAQKPHIGLIGLGAMGRNLTLNIAGRGWNVAVYNREVPGVEEGVVREFVHKSPDLTTISGFDDVTAFVRAIPRPRSILVMVTAGPAVDAVIDDLATFLEYADAIVDCGNSHYGDTLRRATSLQGSGIEYMGMGVSGGLEGARKGPSLMPGGSRKAFDRLKPVLDSIAAVDPDRKPCCAWMGPGGAGHFVKMVHNGIEYAEMQLLAECFDVLHKVLAKPYEEIANVFDQWRRQSDSFLLEITVDILRKRDAKGYFLDRISDVASHKGTGRWTVEEAMRLGVPCDTIAAALFTRQASAQTDVRNSIPGVKSGSTDTLEEVNAGILYDAYTLVRIVNHFIGFNILSAASRDYNWDLNLSEIARVWTGGCIIRSDLMYDLARLESGGIENLLISDKFNNMMTSGLQAINRIATLAGRQGMPVPVFSAAQTYLSRINAPDLPTNLIQAQRDYFGAHGFSLKGEGDGALHHFDWKRTDD